MQSLVLCVEDARCKGRWARVQRCTSKFLSSVATWWRTGVLNLSIFNVIEDITSSKHTTLLNSDSIPGTALSGEFGGRGTGFGRQYHLVWKGCICSLEKGPRDSDVFITGMGQRSSSLTSFMKMTVYERKTRSHQPQTAVPHTPDPSAVSQTIHLHSSPSW